MAALKKCLGVDLGSNSVKIVELEIGRRGLRVNKAVSAETALDPSASASERRDTIAKTIRDLVRKSKLSTRNAVFGIAGQKVFIRRFRLPETTPERLERIVNYEARQQIPFPLDRTDLQWHFTPIPEEKEVEVLLVAVRNDEVNEFMSLVDRTGLKAKEVAVSSFALFNTQRLLAMSPEDLEREIKGQEEKKPKKEKPKKEKKAKKKRKKGKDEEEPAEEETPEEEAPSEEEPEDQFMFEDLAMEEVRGFVDIGASAMDLSIAQMGKQAMLKFCRSVPLAGDEVTRSIMNACQISSFFDAERIKKHQVRLLGSEMSLEEAGEDADVNVEACDAASRAMDRVVAEIRRSLDFFISQPDGMAVDSLSLSGGQSRLSGIESFIEERLAVPVSVTSEMPEGCPIEWPSDAPLSAFVPAFGMALQGIGLAPSKIDFLPEERKITRDFPYKTVAIMIVILAGVIFLASQAGQEFARRYSQLAQQYQGQALQAQRQKEAADAVAARHAKVAGYYEHFAKGLAQRDYWVKFLGDLHFVKPPEVLIDELSFDYDGSVTIIGLSSNPASGAEFNEALTKLIVRPVEPPKIVDIRRTRDSRFEGDVWRFVIQFQRSDKVNSLAITPTPGPDSMGMGFLR